MSVGVHGTNSEIESRKSDRDHRSEMYTEVDVESSFVYEIRKGMYRAEVLQDNAHLATKVSVRANRRS